MPVAPASVAAVVASTAPDIVSPPVEAVSAAVGAVTVPETVSTGAVSVADVLAFSAPPTTSPVVSTRSTVSPRCRPAPRSRCSRQRPGAAGPLSVPTLSSGPPCRVASVSSNATGSRLRRTPRPSRSPW